MLQRALAATLCVLGLVVVGLAVASATVWRPADTLVASATAEDGHALLVTAPGVLDLVADEVLVEATAPGDADVVLAFGRTDDVTAWVGEDPATEVTGLEDVETLATRAVGGPDGSGDTEAPAETTDPGTEAPEGEAPEGEAPEDEAPEGEVPEGEAPEGEAPEGEAPEGEAPEGEAPADGDAEGSDGASGAADPRGSDLWVEETGGTGTASAEWTVRPGHWSVLVAAPGADEPPTLTMTWPREVATPFLVPGVVVGALLLLGGLVWLVLVLLRDRSAGRSGAPVAEGAPDGGTADDVVPVRPTSAWTAAPAAAPVRPAPVAGGETGGAAAGPAAPAPDASDRPLTRRELRLREQEAARAAAARRGRRRPGPEGDATPEVSTGQVPTLGPAGAAGPGDPASPAGRPGTPSPTAGTWTPTGQDGADRAPVSGEAWRRAWGLGTPLAPSPRDPADPATGADTDPADRTRHEEEGR